MTKPIDPFSLDGRPMAKRPGKKPETAEEILRRLRARAGQSRQVSPAPVGQAARPQTAPPPAEVDATEAAATRHASTAGPNSGRSDRPAGSDQVMTETVTGTRHEDEIDSLLMDGPAGASSRSHLPVLAAVFLVSAIAGGTLAGMIFSSRLAPGDGAVEERASAAQMTPGTKGKTAAATTSLRPNETVVVAGKAMPARTTGNGDASPAQPSERPVNIARTVPSPATQSSDEPADMPARETGTRIVKDEARILPAGSGDTMPAGKETPVAASPSAPIAGTTASTESGQPSTLPAVKALPAASDFGKAGGTTIASAGTDTMAGGEEARAGHDELKALTDNVVAALAGLTQAGEEATERQTGNVREALSALVEKALAEGRSQDDVARLLEQALNDSGEAAVPAALRDASGKVDLRLLLASIVPMEAAHRASGAEQDYVNQLMAEGERTVVLDEGSRTAAKGRFYFRDGRRYTRIRPGDTLSRIAFEAYGDVLAYPVILRANAGRISIRRLKPGTEIEVPLRKDAALRLQGPVKLTPGNRPAARKAARKAARRTARKAAKARTTPRKAADTAAQPASETPQTPKKFINFRSRFTGSPEAETDAR